MKTIEGKLIAQGVKVGIVAARFNEFITSRLLSGAMDGLSRQKESPPFRFRAAFLSCSAYLPRKI